MLETTYVCRFLGAENSLLDDYKCIMNSIKHKDMYRTRVICCHDCFDEQLYKDHWQEVFQWVFAKFKRLVNKAHKQDYQDKKEKVLNIA